VVVVVVVVVVQWCGNGLAQAPSTVARIYCVGYIAKCA
jgi:hypothetical protein